MECERCNDSLSAFADDALGRRENRAVRSHLAACRRCREDLAEIRSLKRLLRALPDVRPQPDYWARTYMRMCDHAARNPVRPVVRYLSFGWGVAMAALFILALMMPSRR